MSNDTLLPFHLPAVHRKKLTVDFDGGNQSSDAGLLLLREAERKLGVCRRLAQAMPDRRYADRIRHAMFEPGLTCFSAAILPSGPRSSRAAPIRSWAWTRPRYRAI